MENMYDLTQQVKALIGANKTEEALELLAKIQLSSLDKELIILNNRFNKVKQDQRLNIISTQEAQVELNRINLAVLELSEKIKPRQGKPEGQAISAMPQKAGNKRRVLLLSIAGVILAGALAFWIISNQKVKKEDRAAWNNAGKADNIESYTTYLGIFPEGIHKTEAGNRIRALEEDKAAFEAASTINTPDAYQKYLDDFPDGKYRTEAETEKARLEKMSREERDNEAFNKAKEEDAIDSYDRYLKAFTNGLYKVEAENRFKELQIDKANFDAAQAQHTIASYELYLQNFSGGKFRQAAAEAIAALRKKAAEEQAEKDRAAQEKIRKDEAAWAEAKNKNTIASFTAYRNNYAIHVSEANDKIAGKTENAKREIKVTLVKLVCEVSDDEGPNNDADMDRFTFTLTASQGGCTDNKDRDIYKGLEIYKYDGGPITVPENHVWKDQNQWVTFPFDNEHCSKLNLSISGYAREQDNGSSSEDEEAWHTYSVPANKLFGDHSFKLKSSDFTYRCEFKIEPARSGWVFGRKY